MSVRPGSSSCRSVAPESTRNANHEFAFIGVLEAELNVIWCAQSDVTRKEATHRLCLQFHQLLDQDLSESELANLSKKIWVKISAIVLTEGALKIPKLVAADKPQYKDTLNAVAEFLFYLAYRDGGEQSATEHSRFCACKVMTYFALGLEASQWEVRYRILGFILMLLHRVEKARAIFSVKEGREKKDPVRQAILFRVFDHKDRVAAQAMSAISHYQFEKDPPEHTKAFTVLLKQMQCHSASVVRLSALNVIHICTTSAPAIIRRVFDESWEVRVQAFALIGELLSPKIIAYQLRSYILLTGLNHEKLQVRAAALDCLRSWLEQCNHDYPGLVGGVEVAQDHPLYLAKQLGLEILDPEKAYVPAGTPTKQKSVVPMSPATTSGHS